MEIKGLLSYTYKDFNMDQVLSYLTDFFHIV